MNSDLQIKLSNSQQLIVHSPVAVLPLPILLGLGLLTVILTLGYFAGRATATKGKNIYLLSLWIFSFFLAIVFGLWSHTVTFTRAADDIHIIDKFAGITYSNRHYPLTQLRQAIIETARSGPRIGLLMQNGAVVHPLGEAYNPKPSLDLVLIRMNDFINDGPGGSHADGPSSGAPSHLDRLKQEIEANEELNRKAAQQNALKPK